MFILSVISWYVYFDGDIWWVESLWEVVGGEDNDDNEKGDEDDEYRGYIFLNDL